MAAVIWTGGVEHWIKRDDINLFMWQKKANPQKPFLGTIFFVHGSSMASQPTFDLSVPGRPFSSAMDWFADQGFETWTMDNEGYGRSDKKRDINFDITNGADDLVAHFEKKLNIKVGETTEDGMFTLKTVECLGSCGTAPMLQCGADYHENLDEAKADALIEKLRADNKRSRYC